MENKLVLLPAHELIETLTAIVRAELKAAKQDELMEKLLSPCEARELFQPSISIGTLDNWTSQGKLIKHRIGRKTYYKYGELMEAMKLVRKFGRRVAA